ncbi:ABC transporter substrate-binding protein [Paenibacillus senegalensis]|uniref:ABC transporter substrate-binding protein n=1 Tax=Paenibacillus senegalensis TaxID=1465766 RepID=UPI000289FFC2|nr:ABC transporter substrate-binding protein [Paenibacillus senegalensis]
MLEGNFGWRRAGMLGTICLAAAITGCASEPGEPVAQGEEPATTVESSASPNEEQGQGSVDESQTPQESGDTRSITDALGHEMTVPAEPQRVIASYMEDHLVALGVEPVAQWSIKEGSVQQYLQEWLKDVPLIPHDLPYEAVMSFEPDLILIDSAETVAGDKYSQYSKIAPTFAVGGEQNTDWREELMLIGKALNKEEEASQVLADYEIFAKESRDQIQEKIGDQSAAALWVTAKSVFVVSKHLSSGDVLYRDLELTVPAVVEEISASASANWNPLSLEKLSELDADHLFVVNSSGVTKEELLADPVWQTVPAVKKGQVYEFDQQASWLYTGTIANRLIIEDVLESVLQ